nr:MAG TPA: putative small protein [Caudoviricetes sp.]
MEQEKIFLKPGDIVTLKQDIPNKPTMVVMRKESNFFKDNTPVGTSTLKGIRCRWFTAEGHEQQAVFSTKDLILLKSVGN